MYYIFNSMIYSFQYFIIKIIEYLKYQKLMNIQNIHQMIIDSNKTLREDNIIIYGHYTNIIIYKKNRIKIYKNLYNKLFNIK